MVDLCRGPHLPTTSAMKAVAVTNASRAFWRGDTTKDGLQRVYGIAFTDKKVLHPTPTAHVGVFLKPAIAHELSSQLWLLALQLSLILDSVLPRLLLLQNASL